MSILFDMLKEKNFLIVNRLLIQSIGLDEAILFSELLSKHDYYANRNTLNADGSFYCTISDIEMSTGLKEKTQSKSVKNLKALGLINVVVKGLPAKRYFYIINDESLLKKYLEQGKAKLDEYYNKDNNNANPKNNNTPSKPVNPTVTIKSETSFTTENSNSDAPNITDSVQVSPFILTLIK
jgi:hypothetical protein